MIVDGRSIEACDKRPNDKKNHSYNGYDLTTSSNIKRGLSIRSLITISRLERAAQPIRLMLTIHANRAITAKLALRLAIYR